MSSTKPNDALVKYLDRYCTSQISPGYAVMLRGPWGSGKTWFVENYRERLRTQMSKRSLYVSLFGVNKPADIAAEFFAQLHPALASAPVQKGWSLIKGFVKGTIKLDLDSDGDDDGSLKIDIPDLGKWTNTDGVVLIFDDLERVSMGIDDVLGYINQFVEHDGYRVIVIANEEKVFAKQPEILEMKEKVIGRTFEIKPDFESALDHFLQEINLDKAHNVLFQRKEIILRVFINAGYGNLRQLRQAVLDFTNLWDCLNTPGLGKNQDFSARLVSDVFALSIEYRAGTIDIENILNLQKTDWSKYLDSSVEKKQKSVTELAIERHGFNTGTGQCALSVETYAAFFSRGHLLTDEVSQALTSSPYLMTDNTASWQRLWFLTKLSDADFIKISTDVSRKFDQFEYLIEGELIHVAAMLLEHSSTGLLGVSSKRMMQRTKKVVRTMAQMGKLNPGPKGSHHRSSRQDLSAFGLGFTGRDSALFREFISYYRSAQQKIRTKEIAKWAHDWMKELKIDTETWSKRLMAEYGEEAWFFDEPVFANISGKAFCDDVTQLSMKDLEFVGRAITARFEYFSPDQKWKLKELPFLKQTAKLLQAHVRRLNNSRLSLSQFSINTWLLPEIEKAISRLENHQAGVQDEP